MASLGGAFTGIRNNAVLQQVFLYQLVGQLLSPAMAPFAQDVANLVWQQHPTLPLSPADAAEAVLRNVMPVDRARAEAAFSGVNTERFDILAKLAGNAPAPEALAEAQRRGLIDHDRYLTGVRQGRLRDEWADTVQQLAVHIPSPEAWLGAYLEGQISEGDARAGWALSGGRPQDFDWMFNAQGQAPTPTQAAEMANRGLIPWDGSGPQSISFTQAFLEGPWRNKWLAPFRAAAAYLPPPRTVVAMLRAGSITRERATELLKKQGLADDLVAAYIADASAQKTQGSKDLSQTIIVDLYRDSIIARPAAVSALEALGYDSGEAGFILDVADAQLAQRFLSSAIGAIHTRYVAWHIDRAAVSADLGKFGVDAPQITDLLAMWDIERQARAPTLTAAQVGKAYKDAIIDRPETYKRLEQLGYSAHDAWIYVSQYLGGKDGTGPP